MLLALINHGIREDGCQTAGHMTSTGHIWSGWSPGHRSALGLVMIGSFLATQYTLHHCTLPMTCALQTLQRTAAGLVPCLNCLSFRWAASFLFGSWKVIIVGAHMLICIYAQSQSKYISVFSLILFLYYFYFTVRTLFQFFPNFSLFFLPFYSLQKPVILTRHC